MSDNQGTIERPIPSSVELAKSEPGLRPEQQRALALLLAGKTVAATAREAGVDRTTVYVWLKRDEKFMAAFKSWSEELETSAKGRMVALLDTAVDAVEASLKKGDGRLGLRVLEKMGATKNPTMEREEAKETMRKKKIEEAPPKFTEQLSEFTLASIRLDQEEKRRKASQTP